MRKAGLLTVENLINILQNFNPERVVIISIDSEGNGFSPLSEVTMAAYFPLHPWDGEIGLEEVEGGIPCIILEPRL